jgi:electron transfer flavoprotein alpha subunit
VAELLGCVQITAARNLSINGKRAQLQAERELDTGYETVECHLPALVTVAEDIAEERFATQDDRKAAAEKPITDWSAADLAEDLTAFGAAGSPTRVEAIREGEEKRTPQILESELEQSIPELVRLLREQGALARKADLGDDNPTAAPAENARLGNDFWVVAEAVNGALRSVTFELLGKASELARASGGRVVAFLMGHEVRDLAEELTHCADEVLLVDDPVLVDYSTDAYAAVLTEAIRERDPRSVLMPSTWFGRDLAPRIAARLKLGLTGDCIGLELDEQQHLVQWKPAFGGNIIAPILSSTRPEMATLRPGMLPRVQPAKTPFGSLTQLRVASLPPIRTLIVDRSAGDEDILSAGLDDAPIVIGVGKGIGGPENLSALSELADVLGGAPLATTRDVTDEGWLPRQHQVGLTGRAISPRLYIGIGIRGAFEHMVGLRRAGTIVAINKMRRAPVFKRCDFGIVAEWQKAVPLLVAELKKLPS